MKEREEIEEKKERKREDGGERDKPGTRITQNTHTLCALSIVIGVSGLHFVQMCVLGIVIGVSGLHCVQRLSMIACCQDLSDKNFLNTVLVNLGPLSNTLCSSNPRA